MAPQPERLVIVGSGPAAWTAALYAARAGLAPLVYEGEPSREMIPGGQLMYTTEVENFPTHPAGIGGQELMERFRTQALRFGTRVVQENVASVDFARHPFVLRPSWGQEVSALAVVVATGARARWLGVPHEERLAHTGGGVSACAVCDGALPIYRGQVVAVVGGGDSAMEEALYLARFAHEVVVVHRRDEFRASRIMAERVLAHPRIRVLWNQRVSEVLGRDHITGVRLVDTVTGEQATLEVGGLFVAIGHVPNTGFLVGQLELLPSGYVRTHGTWSTSTSVPGVFAAGDVMDDRFRQAITAAGTGAMAAIEAERWLAHQGLAEAAPAAATEVVPAGAA